MTITKPSLSIFVRGVVSIILIWAAVAKLAALDGGPTLYDSWINEYHFLKYLVPSVEILAASWLLLGWYVKVPSLFCVVLLSAFSGLIAREFTRDHPLPCGCMGPVSALYDPTAIRHSLLISISRNAVMILGLLWLFIFAAENRPTAKSHV